MMKECWYIIWPNNEITQQSHSGFRDFSQIMKLGCWLFAFEMGVHNLRKSFSTSSVAIPNKKYKESDKPPKLV